MKLFLSLGSNLGDREDNLKKARSCFANLLKCSTIVETKAILPANAPAKWDTPYLNQVCLLNFYDDIFNYQQELKQLEHRLGRPLTYERWAPRLIDIDILLYGNYKINTEKLSIPHKELFNRAFLLDLIKEVDEQALAPHIPNKT